MSRRGIGITLAGGALPVPLLLTATACADGTPIPPAPTATPTSSPTQVTEPSPSPGPPIPGPLLDLASQPPVLTVLGIDTQDFAEGVPSPAHGVGICGGAPGDGLGYAVLGADVNGDGVDDVLVGAPGTSGTEDPRTDQGQVYVFFGSKELKGTLA